MLKQDIAVARYGGTGATEGDVRRRLVERIAVAVPGAPARTPRRLTALVLVGLAAAVGWLGWPQPGSLRYADRARAADQMARERKLVSARAEWQRLWNEGGPDAALAARMSWSALAAEHVPDAAAWAMRGRAGEARSAALQWAAGRVREAGGLVGAESGEWPVRTLEWAGLAFVCALLAPLVAGRWWNGAGLLALAIAAAAAPPMLHARLLRTPFAVVQVLTPLEGAGIDLDPGQVVHIVDREGDRARVFAGRGAEGEVPADAVREVWAPAP